MPSARDIMMPTGGGRLVAGSEGWSGAGGYAPGTGTKEATSRSSNSSNRNLPRSEVLNKGAGGKGKSTHVRRFNDSATNALMYPDEAYDNASEVAVLQSCGPQFFVYVDRSAGSPLGIEVEHYADHVLIVMSVGDGLIQDWNIAHPDMAIEEQDLIVGANSAFDHVESILEQCRINGPLKLAVRRPAYKQKKPKQTVYDIILDKTSGNRLGIDVNHDDGRELVIESIEEGLVADWNRHNPDKEVLIEDRIVKVNGFQDDIDAMLSQCQQDIVLEISLLRTELEA